MATVSQPSGTVTLVFTDIEGSTRLLAELGQDGYRRGARRPSASGARGVRPSRRLRGRLRRRRVLLRVRRPPPTPSQAVAEALTALAGGPIRIRVGVHTGEPGLDPPKYVGLDVHKAARIMAAGHGGQVLSQPDARASCSATRSRCAISASTGSRTCRAPQRLYQLGGGEFPPLKTLYRTNLPRAGDRVPRARAGAGGGRRAPVRDGVAC